MTPFAAGLRRPSASAFALALAALSLPHTALAQAEPLDEEEVEAEAEAAEQTPGEADDSAIVVTGTILRGVAPVGSSIISLNATDIQKTGLLTTTDILRSIPQVSSIGAGESFTGSNANNANLNIGRANSLNIRGLGIQATLNLFNGRRVPVGGFGGQLFDPNSLPAIALGRIDVVADGASATYGSDAVAGVANMILRTDVEGVEARARYGFADDHSTKTGSAIAGHRWDTGRIMVAAEYSENDQLLQSDRAEFFSCNQLASGGINNCTFGGAPGNIVTTVNGVSRRFGLPAGTGVGVTEAQLLATPNRLESFVFTTAIPANKRFNVVGSARQDVTDGVSLWAEGFFFNRKSRFYTGSPNQGSASSIPNNVSVPISNPNFVRITGTTGTAATMQQVEYSIFNDTGDGRIGNGTDEGYQAAAGADVDLFADWQARAWYARNGSYSQLIRNDEVNAAAIRTALACTVPGICLNPYGTGGSASNLAALQSVLGFTRFQITYGADIYNGQVDGTLATIPGGDIKLAIGGQHMSESIRAINDTNAGTRPTSIQDVVVSARFGRSRNIDSAFAELVVPLFGADNAVPGIQALELNVAGRYDDYSDVGSTTNPKFGVKWEPIDGLTLRGSYGKSFRAPTLVDVDPLSTPSLSVSNTIVPGRNTIIILGGNPNVKPEKATTWSAGFEYRPDFVPGLFASLNYFDIDYKNVIDTPGNNPAVFTDPALAPFLIPVATALNTIILPGIASGLYAPPSIAGGLVASNIFAVADGRKNNGGRVQMNGLDINLGYNFDTAIGDWTLGFNGTRIFNYDLQAFPGGIVQDRVNNANFPLKFKARGQVGWRSGGLSVNTFYNYANAYRVVALLGNNLFTPALPAGTFQNERVRSHLTVDATVTYEFPDDSDVLGGISLSVSAQNLFDRDPPFARISQNQTYDPGNASVLGRFIAFEVRKRF